MFYYAMEPWLNALKFVGIWQDKFQSYQDVWKAYSALIFFFKNGNLPLCAIYKGTDYYVILG